jgi:nucleotide-binding universal stress UspA family protein
MALAIFLAVETGRVGLVTAGWIAGGMLLYWGYFKDREVMERPNEVLHEEALVSVNYSVLTPVANVEQAAQLGRLGGLLAKDHKGEVLALNVVTVPPSLNLSDGRLFLKEGRPPLEKVIEQARELHVPVHTMIRLGRSVSEAIMKTTAENASDFILFGWPGTSGTNDRMFGSVIDYIVSNPPADIGIVRVRPFTTLKRILVPVAGGPNGRLALSIAMSLARSTDEDTKVVLLHVMLAGVDPTAAQARAESAFRQALEGAEPDFVEKVAVTAETPLEGILQEAAKSDMVVIGATKEPLFRNLLMGNVAQSVVEQTDCTVIVAKQRSGILASMLRETVLSPIHRSPKLPE